MLTATYNQWTGDSGNTSDFIGGKRDLSYSASLNLIYNF